MRWWLRLVLTLVLAPVVWRLAALYLETAQGGDAMDLSVQSGDILLRVYLTYTLPAAALIVLLLTPAEFVLRRLGADLLIVGVAPALAWLVPIVLSHFIRDPRLDAEAVKGLAFIYGLVWGLTIREPRTRRRDDDDDAALFGATSAKPETP